MKTYRAYNLVKTFTPSIVDLFGSSYDWASEDIKFEDKLRIRSEYLQRNNVDVMSVSTSFIDLLLGAWYDEKPPKDFLGFINDLLVETLEKLPMHKKSIKESFMGTITNLDSWNYLNPIGELSVLKKLIDTKDYELKKVECEFPNGSTKDYLFKCISMNNEVMVEVLNIHVHQTNQTTNDKALTFIEEKIKSKILKETKNIVKTDLTKALIFSPVLWHIDLAFMSLNYGYFKSFSESFEKKFNLGYHTIRPCSFLRINDRFAFGDVLSLVDSTRSN